MTDQERTEQWNRWRELRNLQKLIARQLHQHEELMRKDKELAESLDDYYS